MDGYTKLQQRSGNSLLRIRDIMAIRISIAFVPSTDSINSINFRNSTFD